VKLVVDTNLIASGLLWRGKPARLLRAILDGRARLVMSAPLLEEFDDVVSRAKLAARIQAAQTSPEELAATIRGACEAVAAAAIQAPPALHDPDDLAVLACAVSGGADAIVTGDKDLLMLESFEGIPILKAREALEKLGMPAE
jgi:putative PIN family toxin of toxin-antitoxin system